ncbi:MAG: saccharopine dehydrogenase family protein [Saprospiraceae bacterium]
MKSKKVLLYGANGYTAGLIIESAHLFNIHLILAGRNEKAISELGEKFGLHTRIFGLDNHNIILERLKDVDLVLHCAGPFIHTAHPMMKACIAAGIHYMDITGEISVFEMAARLDEQAKEAGIQLMPGTGFDVVPTDCMAAKLKKEMPFAQSLELAFAGLGGGLSHGTALTMIEGLGEGGAIRENGKIRRRPMGHKAKEIPFEKKPMFCMCIPWGDVSSAYYSTGIPNIEVYSAVKPSTYKLIKLQKYVNWIIRMEWFKNMARRKVNSAPAGPDKARRAQSSMQVWGKVTDGQGKSIVKQWLGPEGYTFTAFSALYIAKQILEGHYKIGFQTPSMSYGTNLVDDIVAFIDETSK